MTKPTRTRPGFGQPAPELLDEAGQERYARVRTFTRRGDRMSTSLQHTWDKYASRYVLELERGFGFTTVATDVTFDTAQVFGNSAPLVVEVGCGNGLQITTAAAADPQRNYLGFEVWLPGLAKAMSFAEHTHGGLDNLRLVQLDATQALPVLLPAGSVAELWSFFPDPWRKKRHHKRRLVGPDFAAKAATLLAPSSPWRMATDWMDYAWQMRDVIESTPGLRNAYAGQNPHPQDPAGGHGGFAPRFAGRVVTAFEARAAREGREVWDLCAVKDTPGEPADDAVGRAI